MKTGNEEEMLVYLVDDDPFFTKAMESFLTKEVPGVRTITFPTGEACLHEMHRNPDLILLDYLLDSEFAYAWNGLQVLKRISSLDPGLQVIVLSSRESVEIAMECVNHGAQEYFVKNEKVFTKVRDVLVDMKETLATFEMEDIGSTSYVPQWIGLSLLVIFVIILLLKL